MAVPHAGKKRGIDLSWPKVDAEVLANEPPETWGYDLYMSSPQEEALGLVIARAGLPDVRICDQGRPRSQPGTAPLRRWAHVVGIQQSCRTEPTRLVENVAHRRRNHERNRFKSNGGLSVHKVDELK